MKENTKELSKSLLSEYFDESVVMDHPSMTLVDGNPYRLQITLRNETAWSYPYALLYRVKHEPGEDLTLTFSGDATFTLRGVNLHLLFDALNRQQVESIRQVLCDDPPAWNAVSVLSINVELPHSKRQKNKTDE